MPTHQMLAFELTNGTVTHIPFKQYCKVVKTLNHHALGKKLKELRMAHSYTQDYVASVLNIARQTYSHYETGKRTPSTETLYQLSQLYQISMNELMPVPVNIGPVVFYDFPGQTQSSDDLEDFLKYVNEPNNKKKYLHHTILEKELLYYFGKLNKEDKEEIIEFTKIKARKHKK